MVAFTPDQKKTLKLTILFGVVLLVLLGWFWISVGKKTVASKEKQIASLSENEKTLNRQLRDLQGLAQMRDQFTLIERRLDQISRRLPASPEAPGFQEALSDALRSTGIDIRRLAPEKINDFDRVTEIPYSIEASGRYHGLGEFVTLVEENPQRFMRVKSIKMENDPERPSLHPVSVGIATFMFRDTPAETQESGGNAQ